MFHTFRKELSINREFNSLLHFNAVAVLHCFLKTSSYSSYLSSAGDIFYFLHLLELDCLLFSAVYETISYYWIVSSVILTFLY